MKIKIIELPTKENKLQRACLVSVDAIQIDLPEIEGFEFYIHLNVLEHDLKDYIDEALPILSLIEYTSTALVCYGNSKKELIQLATKKINSVSREVFKQMIEEKKQIYQSAIKLYEK